MEMFTLKRSASALMACCRACGHEQILSTTATEQGLQGGVNIECERCPSEEAAFVVPEPSPRATTGAGIA